MHWDHIQGFPFFAPAFVPGTTIHIYAPEGGNQSLQQVLGGQMNFTYFPVELDQLPARIEYHELSEGEFEIAGLRGIAQYLNHTSTTLGYRLEGDDVSVVYLTDHEPYADVLWRADAEPGLVDSILHEGDRRHARFMADADLLIHDAQYTPEEYAAKKNWGHSHYQYVTELAAAAGVRRLALTHHDPTHDDRFVKNIEQLARAMTAGRGGPEVFCAHEGLVVDVKPSADYVSRPLDVPPAPARAPLGKASLLLVDDNADLRRLTTMFLRREGFDVREAADGAEALDLLEEATPDLVLLDLDMPVVNGQDVLSSMRRDPALSGVPVLVLTGSSDEASLREVFDAGVSDYISKPFSTPLLVARVRACLARAARQKA